MQTSETCRQLRFSGTDVSVEICIVCNTRAGRETEVEACLVNQAGGWSAEQVWRADT